MANNPYVNKVQKADGTVIIDISDTTATASDVLNSKYFYTATGQKVQGSASYQTIYSGSSTPSSSTGVNGDVYIKTS